MKPSIKKVISKISFFFLITSCVGFLAVTRYSYMADTELAGQICIAVALVSLLLCLVFRYEK